ncbi:hypothetical protein B0H14DRAFT_3473460 [Mycena olivaceomarginata]|nr:hypothetical protein B0H14DRAFT_3473460 [Mycena olivaceomarginata]
MCIACACDDEHIRKYAAEDWRQDFLSSFLGLLDGACASTSFAIHIVAPTQIGSCRRARGSRPVRVHVHSTLRRCKLDRIVELVDPVPVRMCVQCTEATWERWPRKV